jgi:hypothetical protein
MNYVTRRPGFVAGARGGLWPDSETSEPINNFRLLGYSGRNLLASRISQGGPQRNCRKGLTISAYFGRTNDRIGELLNLIVEYYGQ